MSSTCLNNQKNNFLFYQTPKFLFEDERYAKLSIKAINLYAILYDRHRLSVKNHARNPQKWCDDRGIYIIFTREAMAQKLRCSTRTIIRLMKELTLFGLVSEKRMGCNCANRIYMQSINAASVYPSQVSNKAKEDSLVDFGCDKKTQSDMPKIHTNNNKINNKYYIDRSESILPYKDKQITMFNSNSLNKQKYTEQTIKSVRKQIDFDFLKHHYKHDIALIEEFIRLIVDVYTSQKTFFRIRQEWLQRTEVIAQMKRLTHVHMIYIVSCFKNNCNKVRNIRSYMLTCLYNAPDTIHAYYQNELSTSEPCFSRMPNKHEDVYCKSPKNINKESQVNDIIPLIPIFSAQKNQRFTTSSIHYQNERQYTKEEWQEINKLLIE